MLKCRSGRRSSRHPRVGSQLKSIASHIGENTPQDDAIARLRWTDVPVCLPHPSRPTWAQLLSPGTSLSIAPWPNQSACQIDRRPAALASQVRPLDARSVRPLRASSDSRIAVPAHDRTLCLDRTPPPSPPLAYRNTASMLSSMEKNRDKSSSTHTLRRQALRISLLLADWQWVAHHLST